MRVVLQKNKMADRRTSKKLLGRFLQSYFSTAGLFSQVSPIIVGLAFTLIFLYAWSCLTARPHGVYFSLLFFLFIIKNPRTNVLICNVKSAGTRTAIVNTNMIRMHSKIDFIFSIICKHQQDWPWYFNPVEFSIGSTTQPSPCKQGLSVHAIFHLSAKSSDTQEKTVFHHISYKKLGKQA